MQCVICCALHAVCYMQCVKYITLHTCKSELVYNKHFSTKFQFRMLLLAKLYNLYTVFYRFSIVLDNCGSVTCQNGGACVNGINKFTCSCTSQYTGTYCQTGKLLLAVHLFIVYVY